MLQPSFVSGSPAMSGNGPKRTVILRHKGARPVYPTWRRKQLLMHRMEGLTGPRMMYGCLIIGLRDGEASCGRFAFISLSSYPYEVGSRDVACGSSTATK